VAVEGDFGIFRGVGWFGWVLGGLRWLSRGFSHNRTSMKPTGKSIGGYRGSTGGLQEDAKSSFGGFEGRKVGGKGS